jgi:sugar-specific transcriptional regulator TrmB
MAKQLTEDALIQVDAVNTLIRLGLTLNQARIYLALVSLESASADAVSKTSKIARQDIYRVMPTLKRTGLVEEIIATPTIFKPIQITDALKILLERRNKETSELLVQTEEIGKNFKGTIMLPPAEGHQFILVPSKEALLLKLKQLIESAQESIWLMIPIKKLLPWLFANSEALEKAVYRNVSIRIITEQSEEEQLFANRKFACMKEASFEVRYITTPLTTCFGINDEQEILVSTSAKSGPVESPALWSNNSGLIELGKKYFEQTWKSQNPTALEALRA